MRIQAHFGDKGNMKRNEERNLHVDIYQREENIYISLRFRWGDKSLFFAPHQSNNATDKSEILKVLRVHARGGVDLQNIIVRGILE